jgi:uncharacterized protein
VQFLRMRPEVDPRRIGLIGHSEGGMIGPMVAAADPTVAFVVLMAGPGLRGDRILELQIAAILKGQGAPPQMVEAAAARERKLLQEAEAEPAKAGASPAGPASDSPDTQAARAELTRPWYRYFITYDPAPTLAKLRCPVLAVGGTLDTQVPVAENTPALKAALAQNRDAKVVELKGLNHLLQPARSGAPVEYYAIEETMAPVALKTIGDWVVAHSR